MYDRLLRLYTEGRLSDTGLDNAVSKGWITEEEAIIIRDAKTI